MTGVLDRACMNVPALLGLDGWVCVNGPARLGLYGWVCMGGSAWMGLHDNTGVLTWYADDSAICLMFTSGDMAPPLLAVTHMSGMYKFCFALPSAAV